MKPNDFRKIALRMQDAIEGEHMAHPDFRVNGRIFATLHSEGKQGMVKMTLDQRRVGTSWLHDGATERDGRRDARRGDDARMAAGGQHS